MDDRPSTGPLGRSEKAALVSGSSSALGRRRRVSAGWVAVPRGGVAASRDWPRVPAWLAVFIGWLVVFIGWLVVFIGWLVVLIGWLVVLIGWLLLAAARTGRVAPGSGGFMLWTGCVAA
jgi:hypothetical protein